MSAFSDLVTSQKPSKLASLPGGKSGALLATYDSGLKAVIKISKEALPNGKTRQRGIPVLTHPQREIAFYELAKLLGFDHLVPETVLTTAAVPGFTASAQLFVPAQKLKQLEPELKDVHADSWMKTLASTASLVPRHVWRQLLALDLIACSRDRHAGNVGLRLRLVEDRPVYRLVAWDNAVSFGKTFRNYHNVFHKALFRTSVQFDDVWSVLDSITDAQLTDALSPYLDAEEVEHACARRRFFQEFPYRLPWKMLSRGHEDPADFPDYRAYFEPFVEAERLPLSQGVAA